RFLKQEFVKLCQGGQFKFTTPTSRNLTHTCSDFRTGIQNGKVLHDIGHTQTIKLSTHNIDIKTNILTYYKFGLLQCFRKLLQHLLQCNTLLLGKFCRNSMYFFSVKRNIKPLRINKIILMIDYSTHLIVQLPSNLNGSWPIIHITYRGIPSFR